MAEPSIAELYEELKELVHMPCICGSGLESQQLFDARGIYVSWVCRKCEQKVRSKFRPEIFTNSHYEVDEPIEDEGSEL